jgi:hypothetical protein
LRFSDFRGFGLTGSTGGTARSRGSGAWLLFQSRYKETVVEKLVGKTIIDQHYQLVNIVFLTSMIVTYMNLSECYCIACINGSTLNHELMGKI